MIWLAALALAQSAPAAYGPIGFANATLDAHRTGGPTSVAIAPRRDVDEIDVRVTIASDGKVIAARLAPRAETGGIDPAPAIAAARHQRFRPFVYRGVPVTAVGVVSIDLRPPSEWRNPRAKLPPIDYASLKITLVRTACFGWCPDYRVTIDGAGNVVFSKRPPPPWGEPAEPAFSQWHGVLAPGEHRTKIDRAALDALIEKFRAAHFFGLKAKYRAEITDNPSYIVSFESGGKRWSVEDYVGERVGMPGVVTALEEAIDATAGTARWVTGDARAAETLIDEGLDPLSADAQRLALLASVYGSEEVPLYLIRAGLQLDADTTIDGVKMPMGRALLEAAARNGKPWLFQLLADMGWLRRLTRAELNRLFAESAGGCTPETAKAMVAAGADANTPVEITEANKYQHGGNVLRAARATYGPCRWVKDRASLILALLALGADPNAADDKGQTAVFGSEDSDLLELLLAGGARADIKDKEGNSPLLSTWSDAVTLRLLEAGADPGGKRDGMSMREYAKHRDWPATLAWLDAHGTR